jgi:hypothetical protein
MISGDIYESSHCWLHGLSVKHAAAMSRYLGRKYSKLDSHFPSGVRPLFSCLFARSVYAVEQLKFSVVIRGYTCRASVTYVIEHYQVQIILTVTCGLKIGLLKARSHLGSRQCTDDSRFAPSTGRRMPSATTRSSLTGRANQSGAAFDDRQRTSL